MFDSVGSRLDADAPRRDRLSAATVASSAAVAIALGLLADAPVPRSVLPEDRDALHDPVVLVREVILEAPAPPTEPPPDPRRVAPDPRRVAPDPRRVVPASAGPVTPPAPAPPAEGSPGDLPPDAPHDGTAVDAPSTAATNGPEGIGAALTPRVLHRVEPRRPRGLPPTGEVSCDMEVLVAPTGAPEELRLRGCPERFALAAEEALWQWRWEPPVETGAPARFRLRVTFHPR